MIISGIALNRSICLLLWYLDWVVYLEYRSRSNNKFLLEISRIWKRQEFEEYTHFSWGTQKREESVENDSCVAYLTRWQYITRIHILSFYSINVQKLKYYGKYQAVTKLYSVSTFIILCNEKFYSSCLNTYF